MKLFQATMTGYGFQLKMEQGVLIDAGFVKNEFVLAASENEASRRALESVRIQLEQQAEKGGIMLKCLDIELDDVVHSLKFWKLVQKEGFVFFPLKDEESS